MTTVKLFGGLRSHVDATEFEVAGATVGVALNTLCEGNEGLRAAIFDGESLRPHVRVMVTGKDIELQQGLDTPLGDSDQLAIFPPMAGGQRKLLR
jgi:molybdopterin synthase sulfur carrier subunit